MNDAGIEFSNQTVAVLFGSGGLLSGIVAAYFAKAKNKQPSMEDCRRNHDENKREHEVLDMRVKTLELAKAASDEMNRGIRRELRAMNNKLNRLLGMPQDTEEDA